MGGQTLEQWVNKAHPLEKKFTLACGRWDSAVHTAVPVMLKEIFAQLSSSNLTDPDRQ